MAINGITDLAVTVSVPKPEYEELIRDSERLNLLREYAAHRDYISPCELKVLLGVGVKEGE